MVQLWKETVTQPPVYEVSGMGPPDPKAMEESGQGLRLETSEGTFGQKGVAGGDCGGSAEFLGDSRVGCRTAIRVIGPREAEGQESGGGESGGEEGGPGPP